MVKVFVAFIGSILILSSLGLSLGVFAQSNDSLTDSSLNTPSTNSETPTTPGDTAPAVPIDVGDFSGGETVIGFETLPGVPPPGPFSIGDVTFSEFSSGSGAPGWRLLTGFLGTPDPQLTDNAGISLIRLDFSTPVDRVGMVVGISDTSPAATDYDVRFFNNALILIETVPISVVANPEGKFAGIESAELISRVEIVETSGENGHVGGVDSVRFELVSPVGGTMIPIDTTSLLLAGAQMNAAWLIPVIVSAIGIGIVIARKL